MELSSILRSRGLETITPSEVSGVIWALGSLARTSNPNHYNDNPDEPEDDKPDSTSSTSMSIFFTSEDEMDDRGDSPGGASGDSVSNSLGLSERLECYEEYLKMLRVFYQLLGDNPNNSNNPGSEGSDYWILFTDTQIAKVYDIYAYAVS